MHKQQVIKASTKLILLASVSGLAGCGLFSGKDSYIRNYSVDYVHAKETKPLVMPLGVSHEDARAVMPIPSAGASRKVSQPNVIPAPTDAVMRSGTLIYKIVSNSAGVFIESDASRDLLWERLQAFLQDQHIPIVKKKADAGVIETDWFTPKGQVEHGIIYRSFAGLLNKTKGEQQQLKLRFSLKHAAQKDEWAMAMASQQRPVGSTKAVDWMASPDSILLKGLREDFLVYLVEHSGDQVTPGKAGRFNPDTMTALLKDGNGNPVLKVSSSFDTAWNVVQKALKKSHITVEKANHAAGIFYIALPGAKNVASEDEKSPGFFEKLFGSDKSDASLSAPVYRLILAPVSDGIYVSLEKDVDTIAPEQLSEAVLNKIKQDL